MTLTHSSKSIRPLLLHPRRPSSLLLVIIVNPILLQMILLCYKTFNAFSLKKMLFSLRKTPPPLLFPSTIRWTARTLEPPKNFILFVLLWNYFLRNPPRNVLLLSHRNLLICFLHHLRLEGHLHLHPLEVPRACLLLQVVLFLHPLLPLVFSLFLLFLWFVFKQTIWNTPINNH